MSRTKKGAMRSDKKASRACVERTRLALATAVFSCAAAALSAVTALLVLLHVW